MNNPFRKSSNGKPDVFDTLAFTAAYRDPVSGGYPLGNGYRLFLPHLMRFSVPDGLSPFEGGGNNAYVYCESDPVNHTDPTGHMMEDIAAAVQAIAKDETIADIRKAGSDSAIAAADSVAMTSPAQSIPRSTTLRRSLSAPPKLSSERMPLKDAPRLPLDKLPAPAMEKIVSSLRGQDIDNLALASKTLLEKVNSALPTKNAAARLLGVDAEEGTEAEIQEALWRIGDSLGGEFRGIPRRLIYEYDLFDPVQWRSDLLESYGNVAPRYPVFQIFTAVEQRYYARLPARLRWLREWPSGFEEGPYGE